MEHDFWRKSTKTSLCTWGKPFLMNQVLPAQHGRRQQPELRRVHGRQHVSNRRPSRPASRGPAMHLQRQCLQQFLTRRRQRPEHRNCHADHTSCSVGINAHF